MKIIISHDVDHLFPSEHFFRDLVLEKLIVRSTLELLRRKTTAKEWLCRCTVPFHRKMNYIRELAEFDKSHGIPSTFFFGMSNKSCLGMSYKREKALPYIKLLWDMGFHCGVHGCDYQTPEGIRAERQAFIDLTGREPEGIRIHYVRYDDNTLKYLAEAGYLFDSTDFDKAAGRCIKPPYKVDGMTEFPVCIMDSYLPYDFDKAKSITIDALEQAENDGLDYFTVLFHDPHFGREYAVYKKWYEWLVEYIHLRGYETVSFAEAVKLLKKVIQPA